MTKKLILGLLIGAVLVYLSVRGIRFQNVIDGFRIVRYEYIFPILVIFFTAQVLRSWRWGIILSPLAKVDPFTLFSVTNVGFLAIAAIPARLGELARPYLITKKSQIRMSVALGTIFVERIFDSFTVLFIFIVIVLFFMPLPTWLISASLIFFLITAMVSAVMIVSIVKRDSSISLLISLFNLLPEKYAVKLTRLIDYFIDGFAIITDPKRFLKVMLLSAAIWLINGTAIYILFLAFSFTLPCVAAFVLMIILMIGIAIPAAPGFVGNWHYFCILGLSLFGIPKTDALTFGVIYHFLSLGFVIILGLIFLPFNKFTLSDLKE
jgi:glycosyltransferase 2 family protein